MRIVPVPLTDDVKAALEPSITTGEWEWPELEHWVGVREACAWRIGDEAFAVTVLDDEGDIVLALGGGKNAAQAVPPFLKAMIELPSHYGRMLKLEGRKGWRRWCKDWDCETLPENKVILRKRCSYERR